MNIYHGPPDEELQEFTVAQHRETCFGDTWFGETIIVLNIFMLSLRTVNLGSARFISERQSLISIEFTVPLNHECRFDEIWKLRETLSDLKIILLSLRTMNLTSARFGSERQRLVLI